MSLCIRQTVASICFRYCVHGVKLCFLCSLLLLANCSCWFRHHPFGSWAFLFYNMRTLVSATLCIQAAKEKGPD